MSTYLQQDLSENLNELMRERLRQVFVELSDDSDLDLLEIIRQIAIGEWNEGFFLGTIVGASALFLLISVIVLIKKWLEGHNGEPNDVFRAMLMGLYLVFNATRALVQRQ